MSDVLRTRWSEIGDKIVLRLMRGALPGWCDLADVLTLPSARVFSRTLGPLCR